jgi:putative membrane protein
VSELTPPPTVIVGLIALEGGYLMSLRRRAAVSVARRLMFTAGVLLMLVALAPPLDDLSDHYLFSAHMLQHLLIVLGAAPLLLAGTPGWLLEDVLRRTRLLGPVRRARHPLLAFGLFNVVFSVAHVPLIYEVALANEPLHALEHLVFLATAAVMWLPILSPLPRLVPRYPAPGQVLYLFLQTLPSGLVGALLAGSSVAFYPTYALAPRISPLSAVEDQQLGGLLMWVGTGLYFLIASGVVFFLWAGREEAANRRPVGVL